MGGALESLGSLALTRKQQDKPILGKSLKNIWGSLTGQTQDEKIQEAIDNASNIANAQYEQTRADYAPFRESAYRILPSQEESYLRGLKDINTIREYAYNPDSSPWYKLKMKETTDAINKQLAARGLYDSSYAIDTLRKNAENISAEEAEIKYRRLADAINASMGSSPMGYASNALNQTSNLGSNNAENQASLQLASGQSRAGMYNTLNNLLREESGMNSMGYFRNNFMGSLGSNIGRSLGSGSGMMNFMGGGG
jgi:hypothetical protein